MAVLDCGQLGAGFGAIIGYSPMRTERPIMLDEGRTDADEG